MFTPPSHPCPSYRQTEDVNFERKFFEISEEVINLIFNFLPPTSFPRIASVCRQWNRISWDDQRWKVLCQQRGWGKKDEGQSWLEFAKLQSKMFETNQILKRQPKILSRCTKMDNAEDTKLYKTQRSKFENSINHSDLVVCIGQSGEFQAFKHTTLGIFLSDESMQNYAIEPQKNILVTSHGELGDDTRIYIYFLDNFTDSFSFTVDHNVDSMAIQGNTLALFGMSFSPSEGREEVLRLVNIQGMWSRTYEGWDATDKIAVWEGAKLLVYGEDGNDLLFKEWDFSIQSGEIDDMHMSQIKRE